MGATRASPCLLDTKPLPVVGHQCDKDRSDFAATADYGVWQARILGDKGCLGTDGPQGCRETRGLAIPTPARHNWHTTRPAGFEGWHHRQRERTEGAFHEVWNTGRHPGPVHAGRGQDGEPRPRLLLRRQAGIDVRTFTVAV